MEKALWKILATGSKLYQRHFPNVPCELFFQAAEDGAVARWHAIWLKNFTSLQFGAKEGD
jgi:hypothetical protein